ncbi:hypothetical protein KP79_PYT21907 [Mizuhopecten yessoensis]|uniref:Uncharacterized protein n=2 Tax=Mizuhopecten yessoensis TaxID=6573 RepID=A0A210PRD4_MIZYE|nr:hypothetical protein KP79_PYT21907 [Mizuhopecten yessoensis]
MGSVTFGPESEAETNVNTTFLASGSFLNGSQPTTVNDVSNTETTGSVTLGSQVNKAVPDNYTSGSPAESINSSQSNSSSDVNTTSGAADNVNTTTRVTKSVKTDFIDNVLSCPRFPSRLVKDTLLVTYVDDRCAMEVSVKTVVVRPLTILRMFINKSRVIKRPSVSFKAIKKEPSGKPVICKSLPTKVLDRAVVVEVVKDKCHMVLKVKKVTPEVVSSPVQGQTTHKKPPTKPVHPKSIYLPVLEYLDDGLPMDVPNIR